LEPLVAGLVHCAASSVCPIRAKIPPMIDDPVLQPWQLEYHRLRKLGAGDYWEGCRLEAQEARSKMTPYELGLTDHRSLRDATEMHNRRPPIGCPFAAGTHERAEYERGWNALPPRP
jgi:hypothetical protein